MTDRRLKYLPKNVIFLQHQVLAWVSSLIRLYNSSRLPNSSGWNHVCPSYFTLHISRQNQMKSRVQFSVLQDQKRAYNYVSLWAKLRTFPVGMWGGEWSTPKHTENNVKGAAMSSIHFLKAWNATDSSRLYSEAVGGRTLPGERDIWAFMGFQKKLISQPLITKEASCMGQCSPPTE